MDGLRDEGWKVIGRLCNSVLCTAVQLKQAVVLFARIHQTQNSSGLILRRCYVFTCFLSEWVPAHTTGPVREAESPQNHKQKWRVGLSQAVSLLCLKY